MKKRTLILVVYAESKPSASYAQRLGGKWKVQVKSYQIISTSSTVYGLPYKSVATWMIECVADVQGVG